MRRIDPQQFAVIGNVRARKDEAEGWSYMCRATSEGKWRCGRCCRGVLLLDDPKCRVCHAKITWDRFIDWERVRSAERHIAEMEWRETHP